MIGYCSSVSYVALSGGVGGAKLALGLCDVLEDPGRLTIAANTGDDSRASRAQGLPRSRHAHLYARRPREPGDRLGAGGGERRLHGGSRGARRRDLVLPRRQGPRHPCRAHPAAAGRREPERGHVGPVREAGYQGADRAHERRPGADHRRDRGRPARLPALFRARALPAPRAGISSRGSGAGAGILRVSRRAGGAPMSGLSSSARRTLTSASIRSWRSPACAPRSKPAGRR